MGRAEIEFGGLANSQDETKVPQGKAWAMQNCTTLRGVLEGSARYLIFGSHDAAGGHAGDVGYGFGYGKYSSNEVQRLQLSYSSAPTSGDIDLVFDGQQTTTALAYNATAAQVLTSLEALSNIAIGDVKVAGGPWPGAPIDVTFTGQYANTDVSLMTTAANTLNNSATLTPVERVKGGLTEVYLAAVKKNGDSTVTMYKVDAETGVYTSIDTGLTASDWFFQQYGDRVFAVNATDGLNFYRIGGGWNDGVSAARPKAPVVAPTFTYDLNPWFIDFSSGWTFAQTGLSGSPTLTGDGDSINVLNGASALTAAKVITVTATNSGTLDYQFNDIYQTGIGANSAAGEAEILQGLASLSLQNNDTTDLAPLAESHDTANYGGARDVVYSHYANKNRTLRDNIKKVIVKFSVASWPAAKLVTIGIRKGNVWMNDNVPFQFQAGPQFPKPTINKIRYAYSYVNMSTGAESQLSEEGITQDIPANHLGAHVTLSLRGSSELTTSDKIYVYRKEVRSGVWRRLPTDSNNLGVWGVANATSGNVTFTDKWMEEEIEDFLPYESASFANSRATLAGLVIGAWKQSLVIGSERKVWESFVGFLSSESPRFAPDPDDKTATTLYVQNEGDNPIRGRTVYLSDDRAEDVYAIIGQDTLYGVGPISAYAIVGDSPGESSPPRRLPGSRGAVGKRSAYRFAGGVHVGSEDGLWYYSVGRGFSGEDNGALVQREETEGVRRSWITTLLGSSYEGVAIVEHLDEVWCFNGTKYLVNNRNRRWEEGTFSDSVLAAISVRARGLKFMDSKGRIFTISDSYTDDNGTAVNWNYDTGILEGPRVRLEDLEIQAVGTPRVTVHVYTPFGTKTDAYGKYEERIFDSQENDPVYRRPCVIDPGTRHRIKFSGLAGRDKVTSAAIHFEGTGRAYA